jgi:hypothetical protein
MLQSRLKQGWTGARRGAAGLLLGAAMLAGYAGHAFAQDVDADDDDLSFEQKFIRNLMGGLGASGIGSGIEYRERSPLVIPPARDLPPPEADAATKPAPNWPNDPEKRRKVAKKQKKPMTVQETKLWDDPGRPLTPEEMRAGRTGSGSTSTVTKPGSSASQTEGGNPLLPSALNYTGGLFGSLWGGGPKEETAAFEGEPPRTSLTAPPTGYMTPSPNQAYGLGVQKYVPPKPLNPADLPSRSN